MIVDYDFTSFDKSYSDIRAKDLKDRLAGLQLEAGLLGLPVLVTIEGWESAGKGYIINELTERLDTRAFSVRMFGEHGYKDFLFTRSFWKRLPAKGDFVFHDRSSYTYLFNHLKTRGKEDDPRLDELLTYLLNAEKAVIDDGTLVVKYFLNISKETQRQRQEVLARDKYRDFLLSDEDLYQNLYYEENAKHMDSILKKSNSALSPWTVVNAEDLKNARKFILGDLAQRVEDHLDKIKEDNLVKDKKKRDYKAKKIIENIDPKLSISEEDYDRDLEDLQKKAGNLAYEAYYEKLPIVLVFEGVDAAGKGGSIRRLTKYMDPRGYKVNPTSAPSDYEKDYHYLWRFYNNFPKKGEINIFDRSWYGRLMVERVEGFAKEEEWGRAYEEINNMEMEMTQSGILLIKYFLVIDKDEQLKRFKDREENKPYKLTEEDWRNRDKWDNNTLAINEMLDKTSTPLAPWEVIGANDKKYARIKVLETFVDKVTRALEEQE